MELRSIGAVVIILTFVSTIVFADSRLTQYDVDIPAEASTNSGNGASISAPTDRRWNDVLDIILGDWSYTEVYFINNDEDLSLVDEDERESCLCRAS